MKLRSVLQNLATGTALLVIVTCAEAPRRSVGEAIADAGHWLADAGVPDAGAQTEPTGCQQWEVRSILPSQIRWESFVTTNPDGTPNPYTFPVIQPFPIPEGWEPFAGESLGGILLRHCLRR